MNDQESGSGCLIDITKEDIDGKALKYMGELISKLSKGGKEPRILIHVDEHRKMCERISKENDPGAEFSKGAMAALVMPTKHMNEYPVTVATCTDAPDFPYQPTLSVCRVPVPPFDIERVMKETKAEDEKGNYYYPFHFPFDKNHPRWTCEITSKYVEEGRIFEKDNFISVNDDFVKKNVRENILYYVKEGKGFASYLLFHLFFLCKHDKKDTLVVIDITGGGIITAEENLGRISKWIGEQKLEKYLKGVVQDEK